MKQGGITESFDGRTGRTRELYAPTRNLVCLAKNNVLCESRPAPPLFRPGDFGRSSNGRLAKFISQHEWEPTKEGDDYIIHVK